MNAAHTADRLTTPLPRLFPLAVAAVAVLAFILRLVPDARTVDDAFITFRYSRNLLDGLGFVYNPGVFTLGTSTPLWAFLMAAIGGAARLFGPADDFPRYAMALSALLDALSAALLVCIALRAFRAVFGRAWPPLALMPGVLYALSPMSVTFAIGGMETSLVVLWMCTAWALWLSVFPAFAPHGPRGQVALGVVYALALLTRLDSALWIAPLAVAQVMTVADGTAAARTDARAHTGLGAYAAGLLRGFPWRTPAASAAVLVPMAGLAWATFGSPIPNSVTAKQFAYLLEPGSAFVRMIQTYSTPFFEFDTFGTVGAMAGLFAYAGLAGLAVVVAARRWPRLLPMLVYPWIYLAVFSVLNPLIFRWYMAPPIPAWAFALVFGLAAAVWPLIRRADGARWAGRAVLAAVPALWAFTSVGGWVASPDHGPNRPAPRMAWHAIELMYRETALRLRAEHGVNETTRVASADIGAVGFYTRAVIVDTVGLVTPELGAYYPADPALVADGQNYAVPPALILDTQPDYFVTMSGFIERGLAQDPRFTDTYRLLVNEPFPYYGGFMQVWARSTE